MAHIVLINPKFEISFWGLEHALPLIGKRANMPVAALPLLAALTPDEHSVTIIDENVEPIDFDLCARADIVGVTGMIVQRKRIREILAELRRRGVFTVVGGPWVSVNEAWYDNLADVLFVGEAEETWPQFLSEWEEGRHARRYEQAGKTDMTTVPPPRLDLLKMRALCLRLGAVLARLPVHVRVLRHHRDLRPPPPAQDQRPDHGRARGAARPQGRDRLHRRRQSDRQQEGDQGGAARCRRLAEGATAIRSPSSPRPRLDLADDAELMELMVEANIGAVFVGIESPNEDVARKRPESCRISGAAARWSRRSTASRRPAWKSGPA